jgi:hypothetical protein
MGPWWAISVTMPGVLAKGLMAKGLMAKGLMAKRLPALCPIAHKPPMSRAARQ